MFTIEEIESAHTKVQSGADFPKYIQEIKRLGVIAFETRVTDSHTVYFGNNNFRAVSGPKYSTLLINNNVNREKFIQCLVIHQNAETDYFTFCKQCAETGVEKWIVDLDLMTCTYYDQYGNIVLTEEIPGV